MRLLSGLRMRRRGRVLFLILGGITGFASFTGLTGCAVHALATYYDHFADGDLPAAEKKLEDIPQKNKNALLIKMHYAVLRQLEGNYIESNRLLEEAKKLSDELAPLSLTGEAAALVINDAVQAYSGSIFERVMIYTYKYINYVALGQYNEARIEMRQAELQLREWRLEPESYPYLPFLLALSYEGLGRTDDALVAYRRALLAYGDNNKAPASLKQSYLNLLWRGGRTRELAEQERLLGLEAQRERDVASLVVIGTSGQVSRRETLRVYHFHPVALQDLLISIPVYADKPPVSKPPFVRIGETGTSFELLINLEGKMRDALDEDTPILILRALARALIQQQLQDAADQQQDSIFSTLVFVGRIASGSVADTRSWDSLPAALYISRISLPPGTHTSFASTDAYTAPAAELSLKKGINFYPVLTR